jgi:uncharacterized protein (DUF1778 family)
LRISLPFPAVHVAGGNHADKPAAATQRESYLAEQLYAIFIQEITWKWAMTTSVLSVRVSEEERALLEAASELARTSLSEFIRRKALDAAEADILERRIIAIAAKDWEAFEAWTNSPAREIEGLKDLARKAPTFGKSQKS